MAKSKGPHILGIRHWNSEEDCWAVKITMKQLLRVPYWVWRDHLRWYHDGPHHVEVIIQAKDELEAMMRFNKLWVGLPKIGE